MCGFVEGSIEPAVAVVVAVDGALPGMIGQFIEVKNRYQAPLT